MDAFSECVAREELLKMLCAVAPFLSGLWELRKVEQQLSEITEAILLRQMLGVNKMEITRNVSSRDRAGVERV